MKSFYRCSLLALATFLVLGMVGMASADKATKDAQSGLPFTPTGLLDCTGAAAINCGDSFGGDNSGAVNNAVTYGCVGFSESGPEVVYVLTLATEQQVTITLTGMTADLDLFLLSACDEALCLAYSASVSDESITECLPAGTYYIVVDGYNGAVSTYTISVSCADCPGGLPGEDCNDPILHLCGQVNLQTDTSPYLDDLNPGAGNPCTGFSASGPDYVYHLTIAPGGSVNLTWSEDTYDGSIYLVTDCNDIVGTCLAGDDCFPFPCLDFINYTNVGANCIEAFLVIDGFGGASGLGTLTGFVDCCPGTATESSSWGSLKELFR